MIGDSSALIANALDNASDSLVYILSLFALSRSRGWKDGAARASGVLLLGFAVGVLFDASRRFLTGSEPLGPAMMAMAFVGAVVNAICLWLLRQLHASDVNLKAATTFSFNDFVSNGGILIAGGLVLWTGRNWPDLLVGVVVAGIAVKGGIEILRDAKRDEAEAKNGGQ